jgi:hypothetical protein
MSVRRTSPEWSLVIYRVSGHVQQQSILRTFHLVAWSGVTVLGTQDDDGQFVIVDCETVELEGHARRIVMGIDAGAVRLLRSGVRPSPAARPRGWRQGRTGRMNVRS